MTRVAGALIYRVIPPRSEGHKLGLKIGHAILMMVTFVLMVIGLKVQQHCSFILNLKFGAR